MGNIAETVGQFLRFRPKENPQPPPSYTESPIVAATGPQRSLLLAECRMLLAAGEITPEIFNQLTSKMVNLIGGIEIERNDDKFGHSLDRYSRCVEEPESGIVISVGRHTFGSSDRQSGSIKMQPKWNLLTREEARPITDILEDLATVEKLSYGDGGYYRDNKPVPSINILFYFPPKFQPPSIKLEMLEDPIPLLEAEQDPNFSDRVIKNEQLRAICKRTFAAIKNQPSLPAQS